MPRGMVAETIIEKYIMIKWIFDEVSVGVASEL
jgi:hypothetical protein